MQQVEIFYQKQLCILYKFILKSRRIQLFYSVCMMKIDLRLNLFKISLHLCYKPSPPS
jgi:hypothetical protein